jgi:four helix bundle protein
MIAHRYHDLACWQLANELKRRVYALTGTEPTVKDRKYCDQIRDSARSAPSNIAEGFGRFRPIEFARFLEFAKASLLETHNHLGDGHDLGYIPESACKEMRQLADRAAGATTNLMKYLRRRARDHGADERKR